MPRKSELQVGLLLIVTLVVAAIGILLVGQKENVFRSKNEYFILFTSVSGLSSGSPVQLDGVDVGSVERVVLAEDPGQSRIEAWVTVDSRYAERVRADSEARIKTLGLLGDKYVEITSGSPEMPQIPDRGEIPAAPATNVDELLASGEDVISNVTAITFSLRNILADMEKGEGLLGKLIKDSETNDRLTDSLVGTLESAERLMTNLETGAGPVPTLLNDEAMTRRIEAVLVRLENLTAALEEGDGLVPALLHDPEPKERFENILARLDETVTNLEALTSTLETGDGLLPKLLNDEELGGEASEDLKELLENLRRVSDKLNQGEGTAAQLLNDPEIYQALNDILIGVDESWMLRWLIRSRQKTGIETRYDENRRQEEMEDRTAPPHVEDPAGGRNGG